MKPPLSLAAALCLAFAGAASAQEQFTEGPLWECSNYRTKPDQAKSIRYLLGCGQRSFRLCETSSIIPDL